MRKITGSITHFTVLLAVTDLVFVFLVWIIRPEAIIGVSLFIVLFSSAILIIGTFLERKRIKRISEAVKRLVDSPGTETEKELIRVSGIQWSSAAELVCRQLLMQSEQINGKTLELEEYREYIEEWVHEIKTPLFLNSLVLTNRKDEMSPYVYGRMSYTGHKLRESVEQILYYARLQTDHSDYKFVKVRADECAAELAAEYSVFAEENNISVMTELDPAEVITDKRVLVFMLRQLLDNALKYADPENGEVFISVKKDQRKVYLSVYNNGKGVPPCDVPFIFDKGFTGGGQDGSKATGMGLYLVSKYAQQLCAEVEIDPVIPYESGFGIKLIFTL